MISKMRMVLSVVVAIVILIPPVNGAGRYKLVELPEYIGGAAAINNKGQVAAACLGQAAIWYDGSYTRLANLVEDAKCPSDINDNGDVVGIALYVPNCHKPFQAFLWRNGVMKDIGCAAHSRSGSICAINNKGQVVGNTGNNAFLWDSEKGMQQLGDTGYYASDINDKGQVVGATKDRAFIWQDGKFTILSGIEGINNTAYAINNRDEVVGYWQNKWEDAQAFLWKNGKAVKLGTLGGDWCTPLDINDKGQIVGKCTLKPKDPWRTHSHAFIWQDGKMQDLNDLIPSDSSWILREAKGINDAGQIVGAADVNGRPRAFLLVPLP